MPGWRVPLIPSLFFVFCDLVTENVVSCMFMNSILDHRLQSFDTTVDSASITDMEVVDYNETITIVTGTVLKTLCNIGTKFLIYGETQTALSVAIAELTTWQNVSTKSTIISFITFSFPNSLKA